jgi:diguanylate cyclase (GGDEF)-like protein
MTPDAPVSGAAEFARAWAKAVAGTAYVPMTRNERHGFLQAQAQRLADAIAAEPFNESVGYEVGLALVAADFAAPETLGGTIEVIAERFLRDVGASGSEAQQRLSRLLGSLATGYSWALRDRTLDEQESIRLAALVARAQAELALRASEARFRYAALHDPLTGLANRALFTDRLAEIFASVGSPERVAVCFIDLDAFKAVNDSLGHRIGDQLLIQVGERLSQLVAELGHLVARLGGDEFVVLVEGTTGSEDAIKVADLVLAVLGEPFLIDGRHLRVTASIGIVERAVAETDPTDVMRAADITLHWAKADGKARWAVFDSERNAREVARYTLAAEMPAALERGEFALVYQPIVDIADGRLLGVEALARWHHPRLRTLAPDRFIDLAEESGLIVKLGIRLLEQACRQAVRWRALGDAPPYVSVNLAVRQIITPGLVADIAAVLDHTGLPPASLQLEITESAVMGNDATTLTTLHDLADLGVRLAIDDFGTGYSNLVYLRSLPVHALKLAGQFLRDLRTPTDEAMLQILVTLGQTMDLTVTAEGVETEEQVQLLRRLHCDTGQGWHFGRPAPAEQITHLIAGTR